MLSIIIPTYNEAENIGILINYLKKHSSENSVEIIISDGGSIDKTVDVAQEGGAAAVVSPKKGRAAQMNYGASLAKGDTLYFVHADAFPPESFVLDIEDALKRGFQIGRYQTKFDSDKIILKLNAFFTRFDLFVCYGGDQTLFITTQLFNQINGYKEDMLIMEDYDIVRRARQSGKYKILKKAVLVSARKYETNSWLTVQNANRTIVSMYKKGASQDDMVNKYKEMLVYR
ncbi:MAG TPA: TIGR04283 family arsenosugar biosynthesis glycosyltransferase [Segetibacter sp.]|jgi:rSAM/selenodomain-associated transferase 2